MRRILLALDLSAVCGFAVGDPLLADSKPPISGVYKLPKTNITARCVAVEDWLTKSMIPLNGVTDVYIEQPFFHNTKSESALISMVGLMVAGGMAAARHGCYCETIAGQSWRSEAGLPTRAPKNVMADPHYAERYGKLKDGLKQANRQYVKDRAIEFCLKKGLKPEDDNEADSIGIWYAMAARIRGKVTAPSYDLFGDTTV